MLHFGVEHFILEIERVETKDEHLFCVLLNEFVIDGFQEIQFFIEYVFLFEYRSVNGCYFYEDLFQFIKVKIFQKSIHFLLFMFHII